MLNDCLIPNVELKMIELFNNYVTIKQFQNVKNQLDQLYWISMSCYYISSQYTHGCYCKLSIAELGNFDIVETKNKINKKTKNKKERHTMAM